MTKQIKVIDLFSGPGGLGEGFASYKQPDGNHPFKIAVSIEKDESAHKTLLLRSFFRQFGDDVPKEYYQFLKGKLGNSPEDKLYKIEKFKKQYEAAQNEALCLELGKDNRTINRKIESALGSDECILIGGPPCQAYSLAGRARNKGIKNYNAEKDHRNFLYKEYLKVIAQFQPVAFVMENVKGMLSAKVNGESIYESIFRDLHNPCKAVTAKPKGTRRRHSYKIYSFVKDVTESEDIDPKDFIINSEKYGIPQRRHRVILLGVREDFNISPKELLLEPSKFQVSLENVICDLPKLRSGLSKMDNTSQNWIKQIQKEATKTLESLRLHKYNDVANLLEKTVKNLTDPRNGQGKNLGIKRVKNTNIQCAKLTGWYHDPLLQDYITNHETRGHITGDLQRYLFCSCWAKVAIEPNSKLEKPFPKSNDYPKSLMPNHENFKTGKFADRFRTQISNIPATTITSHISKDGHYYIHPDPAQCRSLTVREAARVQTFPDNYFFCGNRTQQYVQVGNAVPPYLAHQIANNIWKIFNKGNIC